MAAPRSSGFVRTMQEVRAAKQEAMRRAAFVAEPEPDEVAICARPSVAEPEPADLDFCGVDYGAEPDAEPGEPDAEPSVARLVSSQVFEDPMNDTLIKSD